MKTRGWLVVCAVTLAWASTASAQDAGFGAHARPTGAARITPRWDTYLFSTSTGRGGASSTITPWTNVFSVEADIETFVLDVAVPLSWVDISVDLGALGSTHTNQAELGNIVLEGFADIDVGAEHRLLIGGGVALPTATDQLGSGTGGGGGFGAGPLVRLLAWSTSFRNAAAWQDQSFGLWPELRYRFASQWFLFTATGSIPLYIPTNSMVGGAVLHRGNVELMLSLDVAGAVRVVEAIDIGLSFLGWALPSGAGAMGNPDLGQTALTFFVRTDDALDAPIGGGAEFVFNLDNSWGPSSDANKLWGMHFFLYGRFDVGASSRSTESTPSTETTAW
jgi:hypothetical protein